MVSGSVDGYRRSLVRLLDVTVYVAGYGVFAAALFLGLSDGVFGGWFVAAAAGFALVFALPVAIVFGARDYRMVMETPVMIPAVLLLGGSSAVVAMAAGSFVGTMARLTYEGHAHARFRQASRITATYSLVTGAVAYAAPPDLATSATQILVDVGGLELVALVAGIPIALLRGYLLTSSKGPPLWRQLLPSLLAAPTSALMGGVIVLLVVAYGPIGLVGYAPLVLILIGGYWLVQAQLDGRRLAALNLLAVETAEEPTPAAALDAAITAAEQAFPGMTVRLDEQGAGPGEASFEMAEGVWLVLSSQSDAVDAHGRGVLRSIGQFAVTGIRNAQLQARLVRHDRLQTALLAAVGHDLQTPLTVQKGMAEVLVEHGMSLPVDQRLQLASRIAASADRMSRTVAALVDLKRVDLSGIGGEESCCVSDAVLTWVETAPLPEGHKLEVDIDDGPRPLRVRMPAVHVERIVENLVLNACRYQPLGEPVLVRVSADGDGLALTVSDRGPGVAPRDRDRIFAAFGQSRVSGPAGKVGLGLFIVARLTEHAGGRIRIDDRDGGGASFVILLPAEPG